MAFFQTVGDTIEDFIESIGTNVTATATQNEAYANAIAAKAQVEAMAEQKRQERLDATQKMVENLVYVAAAVLVIYVLSKTLKSILK